MEYNVRLILSDPNGASGETSRTLALRTRSEPQPYSDGRRLHVYSPEHKGPRQEPAFTGILEAYYGAGLGDWSVVWERKAQPGDTLLVHAGLYRPERLNYVDPLAAPFEGTFNLTLKGTADKPITIKAAGDGEVVFDGAGNHVLFDVMGTSHHIFDGLTFRNTDVAMLAGKKELAGATNLTVRNCRFENVGFGIWTEYSGSAFSRMPTSISRSSEGFASANRESIFSARLRRVWKETGTLKCCILLRVRAASSSLTT